VEDDAKSQDWQNRGNFLAVFKEQANGKWLVSHLIWGDPPNQQIN
jgi:ketosteroid isomerase-like protein